ncbi:hypothetical protein O0544_11590 [Edwardsiella anguillarum]|nr:hypothetical protein [Edwardsiella anguillarum]
MQGDIAIGMGQQPLWMRDAHAADNQRPFAAEAVNVKTVTNSHRLLLL